MKSLHILAFEKFLPHVIQIFEAVNSGNNRYIVANAKGELSTALPDSTHYHSQSGHFTLDEQAREYIEWCDAIFVHPVEKRSCAAIEAASSKTIVVWCSMGADIYKYLPEFRERMVLPQTRKVLSELKARKSLVRRIGTWIPAKAKASFRGLKRDPVQQAAKKIDFLFALEKDLNMDLPGFRGKKLGSFDYFSWEASLSAGASPIEGRDILIGNSAHWTNNHFDLFKQLRDTDLEDRRILLPLSYGPKEYADAVETHAEKIFGEERVVSLRQWVPVAEYNKLLDQCGTVIMNHVRGQGMGNISSMIGRGARVYLRRENPYATFLKDLGVVFSYITNDAARFSIDEALTEAEKKKNKDIMLAYWGRERVENRARALFDVVSEEFKKRIQHPN